MTYDAAEQARRMVARDVRRCLIRIAADRGCLVDDLSAELMAAVDDLALSCLQRASERISERPTVEPPGPWADDSEQTPPYSR